MKKTYYYHSFDEDIIKNAGQDYKLPPNYQWINHGKLHNVIFRILYAVVKLIAYIYCRFFIHLQFVGRGTLEEYKGKGCFVYANHTQTFGDVIIPSIAAHKHRVAIIVSPANLGIPVIGKLLPGLGALPIPDNKERMNDFIDALKTLIQKGYCIIIYPEAHVWPYYTDIRPFTTSSFHYPVELKAPAFCMTMTYQKHGNGRPRSTCYIDKCTISDTESLSKRKHICALHNAVYSTMKARSSKSNYQYCEYIKIEKEEIQ